MRRAGLFLMCLIGAITTSACQSKGKQANETKESYAAVAPPFVADTAIRHIEAQVRFGPRVPNSVAHRACADYLALTLRRYGAEVVVQNTSIKAYDGTPLSISNIIGSYRPDLAKRILLCAHWDSRPFADYDPDPANYRRPIDGANDGASGVGVLLEIGRLLGETPANVGVDLILFDAEDYGVPAFDRTQREDSDATWCLGSTYWAQNPHLPSYKAQYGILLDMVGDADAQFYQERFSLDNARSLVDKVWNTAHQLGFGGLFIKQPGGYITDDHLPIMRHRQIPTVNIVDFSPRREKGFPDSWHTMNDRVDRINRNVLRTVGSTVLEMIYTEK